MTGSGLKIGEVAKTPEELLKERTKRFEDAILLKVPSAGVSTIKQVTVNRQRNRHGSGAKIKRLISELSQEQ